MSEILSVLPIFKNGHGPSLLVDYTSTAGTCRDRLTNQDRNTHREREGTSHNSLLATWNFCSLWQAGRFRRSRASKVIAVGAIESAYATSY